MTFYLKSGALEIDIHKDIILDNLLAWDVYFEFKTAEFDGTLFHSKIDEDEIEIVLINGTYLWISFGIQNELLIKPNITLNDLNWHTLNLEWNLKELSVYLDKKAFIKPIKNRRLLRLAPKIYLGANLRSQDGYLGCLRSLWIQGRKINLEEIFNTHSKGREK